MPEVPPPMRVASSTVTDAPACARRYATDAPITPAPITIIFGMFRCLRLWFKSSADDDGQPDAVGDGNLCGGTDCRILVARSEAYRRRSSMPAPHGPLQGVKVVACSTAQAGTVPYMLMADLGAEVIKIEVPEGGDNSRGSTVMPGFPSTYFETNNRGVKSVTLNLKSAEGRAILYKLVSGADMFGQNFRPGAAEKNGFGYEELCKHNPRLVYISISGYGPNGPHADLPGTDSMAQALGGIAEAYSTPGQPLRTGIVSVADETCAILAFGGALAALTYARATGIGQKVDCSLLGGQIRLMGWTLTTAMWRDRDPVTGQARITGTADRPGISASFNDRNGKPLVFQLNGERPWRAAMTALGFFDALEKAGFGDLGVIIASDEQRVALLRLLDDLFATGLRDD